MADRAGAASALHLGALCSDAVAHLEELKKESNLEEKKTLKNCTKRIFMTQIITMVSSLT